MATGYISDDIGAASPVPSPASGGEGGQEKLPGRREKRLDPFGSSHAGPPRSPSTGREAAR